MGFGDSFNLGISDALQGIKDAAGILSGVRNTINQGSRLPWQSSSTSRFFVPIKIDSQRWDQLYPYRLLVVDTSKKNAPVVGGTSKLVPVQSAGSAIASFVALDNSWTFSLPITPQQLNIQDQYAINTTATLRGVLEEHGGLKFKMITASGTMGIWPYRESVTHPPTSPGLIQSVFGGTIEAVGNLIGQVNRVIQSATSNHPATKPVTVRPEGSTAGATSTGFYQAQALQQFLEQYAEAKLNPANKGWRLVFDIPKQNTSYIVTPLPFTWQQTANKPQEVMYTLQFKAWRRIDLQQKVSPAQPDVQPISPGILQRVLSTISAARRVTSASTDLIGAVRSDVTAPLDVLRQTSLFVKDLAGVAISVADLPFQIQRDYSSAIKDSMNNLKAQISQTNSDPSVRAALNAVSASVANVEGLSLASVSGGQLGNSAAIAQSLDPSNNIFRSPEKNFSLMDSVPVNSLSLTDAQQNKIDQVLADIRETTVDDLKQFRAVILELSLQLSNNFGAGDDFYSEIYNRPAPTPRIQPMTLDEYDILKSLYDTMQSYDILTATTDIDDNNKQTNMEYVAGLADQSEIPFDIPNSKILVPVPFGLTIEGIAARYLGDPQRWIEIATLNNLRDPYIDENGFQLPLLSNATGRQITVSSIENLYIGQRVVLKSSTQSPTARRILGIDRLSDTSFLLTLDGEPDLDSFVTADQAYLQAYLPGTVNSQQKIFIPSDQGVPDDANIVPPSSVAADPLVGMSKVDWLLTDSGDIAVNSFGDFRFAAGMTNLIQALRIKFGTQKGTVLVHPEFGLGVRVGSSVTDIAAQTLYDNINKMLQEDPRFQGLNSLQVSIDGPTVSIGLGVILTGQTGVFPLTFELAT